MSDVRIRTMNLDAVLASAPLNREASTVRDGQGEHWSPDIPPSVRHFKAPPQPVAVLPAVSMDLTGRKIGRLTVIRFHGYSGDGKAKWPLQNWLVRCTCGDYELRRADRLRKMADPDACCFICQRARQLRDRAAMPSTSKTRERSAELLNHLAAQSKVLG